MFVPPDYVRSCLNRTRTRSLRGAQDEASGWLALGSQELSRQQVPATSCTMEDRATAQPCVTSQIPSLQVERGSNSRDGRGGAAVARRPVLHLSQAELREVEKKQRTLAATNQWSVRNRLKATLLRLPQPERRTRADLVDIAALASCACRFIAQHVCSLSPLGPNAVLALPKLGMWWLPCPNP